MFTKSNPTYQPEAEYRKNGEEGDTGDEINARIHNPAIPSQRR